MSSLGYDFIVAGVIALVALVVHVMAVELFAPGTALHTMADGATAMNGAERADLWYQILAQWVPLGGLFVAGAWPIIRSYRRQAVTAVTRP